MNAVDTNVLIYVRDPRDPIKQEKAVELTTGLSDGVLLWQVACEFISASRRLTSFGFTRDQAWKELWRLRLLWPLVLPTDDVLNRAEQLITKASVSFWDAMLLAACREGGVTRLYTEDFDASLSRAAEVEIVNPFR